MNENGWEITRLKFALPTNGGRVERKRNPANVWLLDTAERVFERPRWFVVRETVAPPNRRV